MRITIVVITVVTMLAAMKIAVDNKVTTWSYIGTNLACIAMGLVIVFASWKLTKLWLSRKTSQPKSQRRQGSSLFKKLPHVKIGWILVGAGLVTLAAIIERGLRTSFNQGALGVILWVVGAVIVIIVVGTVIYFVVKNNTNRGSNNQTNPTWLGPVLTSVAITLGVNLLAKFTIPWLWAVLMFSTGAFVTFNLCFFAVTYLKMTKKPIGMLQNLLIVGLITTGIYAGMNYYEKTRGENQKAEVSKKKLEDSLLGPNEVWLEAPAGNFGPTITIPPGKRLDFDYNEDNERLVVMWNDEVIEKLPRERSQIGRSPKPRDIKTIRLMSREGKPLRIKGKYFPKPAEPESARPDID